jgi:RNA polymerase sigma-70 factor (ECF subfamily)
VDGLIDNEQFLTLLTAHQRRLRGYICALIANRADAEEVLQEVNLYVCQHSEEFAAGTNFAAWVLKISHFCVLKWRDRRSRDRIVYDDSLLEQLATSAHSFALQGDRRREALHGCLGKLAPHDHDLVTQLYGDAETTPQSLAERVGRSTKGIYESLNRIRLKLLDCIQRTLAAEDRAQ